MIYLDPFIFSGSVFSLVILGVLFGTATVEWIAYGFAWFRDHDRDQVFSALFFVILLGLIWNVFALLGMYMEPQFALLQYLIPVEMVLIVVSLPLYANMQRVRLPSAHGLLLLFGFPLFVALALFYRTIAPAWVGFLYAGVGMFDMVIFYFLFMVFIVDNGPRLDLETSWAPPPILLWGPLKRSLFAVSNVVALFVISALLAGYVPTYHLLP